MGALTKDVVTRNGRSMSRRPLLDIVPNIALPSSSCALGVRTDSFEHYLQASSHQAIEKILDHMQSQYRAKDLILQAIASDVNAAAIVQQLRSGESCASIARKVTNGARM